MSWPGERTRTQPRALLQGTGSGLWSWGSFCTRSHCKLVSWSKAVPSLPVQEGLWGLWGQGRADNPAMEQGEQTGLSSLGLEQPRVVPEMAFHLTQRQEHCTAALAFSIFSISQASRCSRDLVASSLPAGVER